MMQQTNDKTSGSYTHAVSRSNELLSCAKTAWKIEQQKQIQQKQQQLQLQQRQGGAPPPPPPPPPPMPKLSLADMSVAPHSLVVLEDGLTLLRSMEFGLKQLQVLVRRRGHTNDPTQEISSLVKQLEQDTKELTDFCQSLLHTKTVARSRGLGRGGRQQQEKKHWEMVVQWFQTVAQRFSKQLQECLQLRGTVLAELAQQHKKILETNGNDSNASNVNSGSNQHQSTANGGNGLRSTSRYATSTSSLRTAAAATPLFDSPLFAAPPPKAPSQRQPTPMSSTNGNYANGRPANGNTANATSATRNPYAGGATVRASTSSSSTSSSASSTSPYYSGSHSYGGYGAGGGYGGGSAQYGSPAPMGMRQRKAGPGGGPANAYYDNSHDLVLQEQQQEEQDPDDEKYKVKSQIQMRQQKRQTQQRLDEARQAESMLGELGQLFGKMSTLIVQQGEVLEKIEDDVEIAHTDIVAAQDELSKTYSLKKGNRPLIIRTFAILIFLIIFMRAYKK